MDHQQIAQLLGSYGEFLGAIAVVATLGYLTVQIKQNTKALRVSAYADFVDRHVEMVKFQAEYAQPGILTGSNVPKRGILSVIA